MSDDDEPWSDAEIETLRRLSAARINTGDIAKLLKRENVEAKLQELGLGQEPGILKA